MRLTRLHIAFRGIGGVSGIVLAVVMGWTLSGARSEGQARLRLDTIKLPPGFAISTFADAVPNARSMVLGPGGTLFVGTRQAGKVYAVVDRDKDFKADEVLTIAEGLRLPNGVAMREGSLYVAALSQILRYDNIEANLKSPPKAVVIRGDLPTEGQHGWKFIAFGPDGLLYVPVGAPCNICEHSEDPRFASILRMKPDGTDLEIFASGVRNTVGFDWHPQSRELWFTDNGRDELGDDVPSDELNRAPAKGLHFGYPYCHAGTTADPEFGSKRACSEFAAPAQTLGPHVASLNARFYTGSMFPPAYRNQIFIAEHGSWNRSQKIGYRISLVRLEGNKAVSYEPFAQGWLQGETPWGRPAGLLVMPDGSLLVSDDTAGAIYRITYSGGERRTQP